MIKEAENKMMTNKDVKNKGTEELYFFPEYGINVEASSTEEAEKKLQVILSKNK